MRCRPKFQIITRPTSRNTLIPKYKAADNTKGLFNSSLAQIEFRNSDQLSHIADAKTINTDNKPIANPGLTTDHIQSGRLKRAATVMPLAPNWT